MLAAFLIVVMIVLAFMVIGRQKPVGYVSPTVYHDEDTFSVLQQAELTDEKTDEISIRDQGSRNGGCRVRRSDVPSPAKVPGTPPWEIGS